jgi:hypothetical protein
MAMEANNELLSQAPAKGLLGENFERSLSDKIKWGIIGFIIAVIGGLSFYLGFSEGGDPIFFSIAGLVLLAIAAMFFSPWKRVNYLIGGILLLVADAWLYVAVGDALETDFWGTIIWLGALFFGGFSLILWSTGTTMFGSIQKALQTETAKVVVRVLFWGTLISIGLLVVGGIFSFLAGLSATTIIIILLVLILLK